MEKSTLDKDDGSSNEDIDKPVRPRKEKMLDFLLLIRKRLHDPKDKDSFRDILFKFTSTETSKTDFNALFYLLTFKSNISVHLCKKALMCINLMTQQLDIAKWIYSKLYPDFISKKHLRVMVVGNYHVGKSTLVNKLCNIEQNPGPESTVGIDVKRCYIDKDGDWHLTNSKDEEVNAYDDRPTVSVWDFAGQSMYYATHHLFLNPRSVYLLVLDLSKDLDSLAEDKSISEPENLILGNIIKDLTCLETFKFWIKSIYSYTMSNEKDSGTSTGLPRVILVGTKKDRMSAVQVSHMKEYFDKPLEPFNKTQYQTIIDKKKFFIGNDDGPDIIQSMRKHLVELGQYEVSQSLDMNNKITNYRRKNTKMICKSRDVFFSIPRIESLLTIQHGLGNILYFGGNVVVLDPQYLLDVMKLFFSHKQVENEQSGNWSEYKKGKCYTSLINEILKGTEFIDFRDDIVNLFVDLHIMAMPLKEDESYDEIERKRPSPLYSSDLSMPLQREIQNEGFYVIPCMLPGKPNKEDLKNLLTDKAIHSPTLCLVIKGEFFPGAVFQQLLATLIAKLEIVKSGGTFLLFKNFGLFKLNYRTEILIWCVDYIVHIEIIFFKIEPDDEAHSLAQEWKNEIERLIKELFDIQQRRSHNDVRVDLYVDCPKCSKRLPFTRKPRKQEHEQREYIDELINVGELLKFGGRVCDDCRAWVTKEEALKYWYNFDKKPDHDTDEERLNIKQYSSDGEEREKPCQSMDDISELIYKRRKIEKELKSGQQGIGGNENDDFETNDETKHNLLQKHPKDQELVELVDCIVSYRQLAIELNIPEKIVERTNEWASRISKETVIFHILYEWRKRGESYYILYKAMAKCGFDMTDFFKVIEGVEREEIIRETHEQLARMQWDPNSTLSDREVIEIANCIGNEFWILGIRLGIPETRLQQIYSDKRNSSDMAVSILKEWRRLAEPFEDLVKALVKCNSDMSAIREIFSQ